MLVSAASRSGRKRLSLLDEFVNPQTGTTYAFKSRDAFKLVTFSNASSIAATLGRAGGGPAAFFPGWFVDVINLGAGTVTITPATSTINGKTTLVLTQYKSARIVSDGVNYQTIGNGLLGTATNDTPAAGYIGEPMSASVASGSAISLTTDTSANLTSLSLTAGDWIVQGWAWFNFGGGGSTTVQGAWISTTSATRPTPPTDGQTQTCFTAFGADISVVTGQKSLRLASTTTVYLGVRSTFAGMTCGAYGLMTARRMG